MTERRVRNAVCYAVNCPGPALEITVDDGKNGCMRLLSCLRYASVPVSTRDNLVTKSFSLALISLAIIILVFAYLISVSDLSFSCLECR